jgi:hypothetical protein
VRMLIKRNHSFAMEIGSIVLQILQNPTVKLQTPCNFTDSLSAARYHSVSEKCTKSPLFPGAQPPLRSIILGEYFP